MKNIVIFLAVLHSTLLFSQTPPQLNSGATTCPDEYCILLTGTDFQSDAYVDVRSSSTGSIIDSYSGSELIRNSNGAIDTLQFTITNISQQNFLNSSGLYFYVVNPGNGWDGPVHVIRTPPAPIPPTLISGETTCPDEYCILLTGSDFQSDAYVDIRSSSTGSVIDSYSGSELIRNSSGATDTLQFTITNAYQRNFLDSSGLYFYVINPGNGWDGPVHIIRTPPPPQPIFMGQVVESIQPNIQDVDQNGFSVSPSGDTLSLTGNTWKAIQINYNITTNTVLEFEFRSTGQEAEVNGVGFTNSLSLLPSQNRGWQVYGTQIWPQAIQTTNNYSGTAWRTYSIPVGQTFTGTANYLVFVGDNDGVHVIQNVQYKNPRLIEVQPDLSPTLISGETTCPDEYCILLTGTNFQNDSFVDVRSSSTGSIIAQYSGSELSRNSNGTTDTLQLTITSSFQQNLLNSSGLYFYVVNPGNGWDGPAHIIRVSPYKSAKSRGGSIFGWYDHVWTATTDPNDHESTIMDFGIIKNYHKPGVRTLVQSQLESMFLEGQRRIGLDIWHGRGSHFLTHGTFINSRAKTDPKGEVYYIDPLYIENMSLYLEDIKNQGFDEVLLNVIPSGCNGFLSWTNWYLACKKDIDYTFVSGTDTFIISDYDPNNPEPRWQQTSIWKENWEVLKKFRKTIAAIGIDYKIDLENEAIPTDSLENWGCNNINKPEQCLSNYPSELSVMQERAEALLRKRWTYYVSTYTKADTLGYSIIAPNLWHAERRSATMASIYNGNYPNYINLHMYVDSKQDAKDALNHFKTMFPNTPIVIGETHYNDERAASYLHDAIEELGFQVEYLLQWPRARIDGIGLEGYQYLPPMEFNEYMSKGF